MMNGRSYNHKESKNNWIVQIFGYGSSLMHILFDLFLNKNHDANKSSDVLNIVLSCKTMYRTCKVFIARRRILWSKIKFLIRLQGNLNLVQRLLYDSITKNNLVRSLPPLKEKIIPLNLTELTFGNNFNQPLEKGILSSNLIKLVFGGNFNQPLKQGILPPRVSSLIFTTYYIHRFVEGTIPGSLMCLTFGVFFKN